jgi:large conductance mechanosensitive channel
MIAPRPTFGDESDPMQSLFSGFRQFIMRGNVLELAVAVVIGTAFTALVNGIVEGLLNPLVALVAGRRDLTEVWRFSVSGTDFRPGLAIDALITFLLVAAAVYFFIKLPMTKLAALRAEDDEAAQAAPALAPDVVLLQEIRDLLARQAAGSTVGAPGTAGTPGPPVAGPTGEAPGAHPTR